MRIITFRAPKTTAELRLNAHIEADPEMIDLGVVVRPKRRNLPSAWEDIYKESSRNWKRYRRTQYKQA